MKSICIVSQSLYEFDARVQRKAEALAAAGYDVDVLTLRTAPAQRTYVRNGVTVHTISLGKRRSSLPRYFFEYVVFFAWAFTRVTLMTWRKRYVVIDVNTLPDFLVFAAFLARWMGAKVVLDMHEITPEFYRSKYGIAEGAWLVWLLELLERVSFNFADRVITVNEPILNLLVSRGLAREKSIVLMNAADENRFTRSSRPTPASTSADRPGFAMLYHGTLTRIYGLDIAIEAFALAEKDMPEAELWIIGLGPEQQALTQQAAQRGLSSRIKVLGPVPSNEIGDWLRRCDAGILPMRRDVFLEFAFPNKLSEFIVSTRPVLVSRLRTMKHYFSEEALAYFEPNTPRDLATQMVRLYRDRELRARLAARAAAEYAPIRWSVMRERYLQLIAELAGAEHRATESAVQPVIAAR
jgi:glycosyltransferase involved in cell wall biosynthesis